MAIAGTTTLRATNHGRSAVLASPPAASPARKAPPVRSARGAKPARPTLPAKTSKPRVELTWNPSPTPDIVGYIVYRADQPGTPVEKMHRLNPTPFPQPCYEDRDVQRGRTYYYVVRALAPNGALSAPSNETVAPIPPAGAARAAASSGRVAATRGEPYVHHGTNAAAKR